MPAISFNLEFLDALLNGDKHQTTRKQTTRIKVGDTAQIYIEQRRRISDKPLRRTTVSGAGVIYDRGYPLLPGIGHHTTMYHAHFLGKVNITEVYDVLPINTCGMEACAWAKHDGFASFTDAAAWFEDRYGEEWMCKYWTVIRWDGWMERYFEPEQ